MNARWQEFLGIGTFISSPSSASHLRSFPLYSTHIPAEKMGRVLLSILVTIVAGLLFSRGVSAGLCSALISPNGYACVEYQTVTDDGFILGLQNIPSAGSPVLLQHGLLGAGDNWAVNSPQESLAYILSNAGYDVWIGNNRCVQWSHGHQSYSPSDNGYWAWTYDELASYDLKATTEFVFNQRGKLFYVGHSQGTLMLLGGLSGGAFKGEVLGYLQAAVLLAPVASVGHLTPVLDQVGLGIYADAILPALGFGAFDLSIFQNLACENSNFASTCNDILLGILGGFLGQNSFLDSSRLGLYNHYFPSATSSYNIDHYGQSYRGQSFQYYDKGLIGNLAAYGQLQPPTYGLSSFPSSLPVQIWSGGLDGLADPSDVASLLGQLPSANVEAHYLSNYGHLDFIMGTQAYSDIYPSLMAFLQGHV